MWARQWITTKKLKWLKAYMALEDLEIKHMDYFCLDNSSKNVVCVQVPKKKKYQHMGLK